MRALITVKDAEEAEEALEGGCDILDIKNPSEGSLGANFPWVIDRIMKVVPESLETSIAVGDAPNLPGTVSLAVRGAAAFNPDYIKVGLKGPANKSDAKRIVNKAVRTTEDIGEDINIVAAGYADYQRAETVDPLLIPEIAQEAGANVAMVDTAVKDGKTLLDHFGLSQVEQFVNNSHRKGLKAAIAGSLDEGDIAPIEKIGTDVFGVRGAVCFTQDRTSKLKKGKVEDFIEKFNSC